MRLGSILPGLLSSYINLSDWSTTFPFPYNKMNLVFFSQHLLPFFLALNHLMIYFISEFTKLINEFTSKSEATLAVSSTNMNFVRADALDKSFM
jgi:hypothetical protein